MTLTSLNCPSAAELPQEVERRVKAIGGVAAATVEVVFELPWTPSMMSEAAKLQLNMLQPKLYEAGFHRVTVAREARAREPQQSHHGSIARRNCDIAAYVKVAQAVDLPPGQAMPVTVVDKHIALFSVDGTVFAIDDTCTHRGGPLSEGELKDGIVTCPGHGAQYNVKDGQVLRAPAPQSISSYPVRITNGAIKVEV